MNALMEARQISVQYPGTLALDRVDFKLQPGQIAALIGENGAGKSTLVKVLSGVSQPTAGEIYLDGERIAMRSVRDAGKLGIGIIHQELNLCPNLSVAENIFLARELTSRGILDSGRQRKEARGLLARLEQPLDVDALVAELPLGQQQIVEIAKALARDVRVLMMDEPTSALSPAEIAVLFRIMRDLSSRGVAIVYISHRLEELLEIANAVTVLRDGRLVAESPASDVDARWIVERMTGRAASANEKVAANSAGDEVFRAEGLELHGNSGRPLLRDVSFSLRKGEVVAIYGLMGAGRTELLESLMGLRPDAGGAIHLGSKKIDRLAPPERIAAGLVMAPEDRKTSGLIHGHSVTANMTISSLDRYRNGPFLSAVKEREACAGKQKELAIKAPGLRHDIGSLSGGNQQKVILARCLLTNPQVLLLDEPTRGVDVGAKREIHATIRRLAATGKAVLVATSELEEAREVADRILVMSRGRISAEFAAADASDAALASAATSGSTFQQERAAT
ncbi:MAG: sugar ABC transporter ATP-binding protein [Bryobacteraceae bacterium]